jgi:mannan polymerase II complex MNN10 subunit
MWHKLVMLEEVMAAGSHDWIWWIDFDTLITNHTVALSDLISKSLSKYAEPDQIDFFLTADW